MVVPRGSVDFSRPYDCRLIHEARFDVVVVAVGGNWLEVNAGAPRGAEPHIGARVARVGVGDVGGDHVDVDVVSFIDAASLLAEHERRFLRAREAVWRARAPAAADQGVRRQMQSNF